MIGLRLILCLIGESICLNLLETLDKEKLVEERNGCGSKSEASIDIHFRPAENADFTVPGHQSTKSYICMQC